MYDYQATVVRVVDGDTVRLLVDIGFHCRFEDNFRLLGINSPEINTSEGRIARDFMGIMLNEHEIWPITTYKPDKYGRWLVIIHDDLTTINQRMIDEGYAVEYDGGAR